MTVLLQIFLLIQASPTDGIDILEEQKKAEGLLSTELGSTFVPFSSDAPWNQPIPEDPAINPHSAHMMERMSAVTGDLKGDLTNWTIPLFVIDAKASPKRSVITSREALYYTVDPEQDGIAQGIPIPDGVWADPQYDGHMVLVDPVLKRSWDFSRFHRDEDGRFHASRIDTWDLTGSGSRTPFSGPAWWTSGARSSGFPLLMGLIRPEHIAKGFIPHALAFAAPNIRRHPTDATKIQLCLPASRTDGKAIGDTVLPMGVRIQLDPNLDLAELGLSKNTRVIARAMQTYGMFLVDGSSRFKVYFQNLGGDADDNPWHRFGTFDDLALIPATAFRVLECEYAVKE